MAHLRALGLLFAGSALAVLAACSGVRVESAGDLAPDPGQPLTYAWAPDRAAELNAELSQQIHAEVAADLAARGFTEAEGAEPDLLLTSSVDVTQRTRVNDPYYFFPLVQRL